MDLEPCKCPECIFYTRYRHNGSGHLEVIGRHNHDLHVCQICDKFEKFDLWTPKERGDEDL